MLDIEFPILAFTHCRDVVAAVTKAGGYGVLGAAGHTPEQLDIDLAWIAEEVGERALRRRHHRAGEVRGLDRGRPLGRLAAGDDPPAHRQFLDDMLDRYGVPPSCPEDDRAQADSGRGPGAHDL